MRKLCAVRAPRRFGTFLSGLLIAALATCCCLASPAGARIIVDKVTGKKFGIVPVPRPVLSAGRPLSGVRAPASATPTCDPSVDATCAQALVYQGGSVVHGENDYLFFWAPSNLTSSWTQAQTTQWNAYKAGMATWLSDLASQDNTNGTPISVTQEYYDSSGAGGGNSYIPFNVQNEGSLNDTAAAPSSGCTDSDSSPVTPDPISLCLTDAQLTDELKSYVAAHSLPTGLNTEYFMLTPQGIGSCDDGTSASCAYSQYCGYHSGTYDASNNEILYANLPWGYGTGCDLNSNLGGYPNANYVDPVTGTFSHELAETMTDPNGDGWIGPGGGADEIGDKCAYQYAVGALQQDVTSLPTTGSGAPYNVTFGSDHYLIQLEYSNKAGGCENLEPSGTKASPSLTVSAPASGSTGTAISPVSATLSGGTAPSGAITFTVFGPQTTAPSDCSSGGSAAGSANVADNGTFSPSSSFTPSSAGDYWWYASYGGDSGNNSAASTCGASMAETIVTGGKASPTLSMSAPSTGTAGTAISAASLSAGLSGGASPTGTITFKVFGPQPSAPMTCSSGGSTVGTASPSGNGTYNPSAGITPSSAGDYWWYASYGGDSGNNAAASTCGLSMAETVVSGGSHASVALVVTPKTPAPRAPITVKITGTALSGGTLGSGHNRSQMTLYSQLSGACASTWAVEAARARVRGATALGSALVAPGAFSLVYHGTAISGAHRTVRLCGYVARSASLTDATATAPYTTT